MAVDKKLLLEQKLPNGAANNTQTGAANTNYKPVDTTVPDQSQAVKAPQGSSTQSSKYTGLSGLSNTTQYKLGSMQNGYTASAAVQQAQAYLDNLLNNKPGDYASNYTQQLNDLYSQITNRGPFKYDLNADMLYQQAKDQYMQTGQQAMMDTMGQAAALTGGYGSSYASTAGNQAYQQYLTQLNSMIPEYYDRAAAQYEREGQELYNRYSLTQQAGETDYNRYLAALDQWNADRSYGLQQYDTLYNQDYGAFADERNYWANLAAQENANYWNVRNQSYQLAMAMLQSGKMPSADMLAAAGISAADASKWTSKANTSSPGGPSSSSNTSKSKSDVNDYLAALAKMLENEKKIYKPTGTQIMANFMK